MNLNNLFITFFLLIIISCTINESIDDSKKIVKTVIEKKDKIFEKRIEKNETNNSNNKRLYKIIKGTDSEKKYRDISESQRKINTFNIKKQTSR